MTFEEDYLKLIGQIDKFAEEKTGTSLVDAYFGPRRFSPEKTKTHPKPEQLLASLDKLIEETREITGSLRRTAIESDIESLKIIIRWLAGEDMTYKRLVEGLFGVTPTKFTQKEIRKAQQKVEETSTMLPGKSVCEKILKWRQKNKISGERLKKTINTEMKELTRQIEQSFQKHIFAYFPTKIENNGVIYKTVRGKPWGGYNYYKGNYMSINAFNIDNPFNKHSLIGASYHEYEHHVSNLCTEKYYRENKALDLAAVLLNTKRSIIAEGTADCAREFLNAKSDKKYGKLFESLRNLGSIISLNIAYMLNVESVEDEAAAEYLASEAFIPVKQARKSIEFSKPSTPDGKPNLFKAYVYTYYFGRKDYVLPTFKKAQKKDKLKEFFQTLYLNPYSRSSATWNSAFSNI
jgi:hypothetical protein